MIQKKQPKSIIDSRYLKILSIKKQELKDAILFVCLNEEKYGYYDIAQLRQLAESINRIEPNGFYFVFLKNLSIDIYDKQEFKNKDVIVTLGDNSNIGLSPDEMEEHFKAAFDNVRSIKFVHANAQINK